MATESESTLHLKVSEGLGKDVGRAFARMDPADIRSIGAEIGDIVEILGKGSTVCKAMPAYKEARAASRVQLDGVSRANAGVSLDDTVSVRKVTAQPAQRVVLSPQTIVPTDKDLEYIGSLLDGLPVIKGDLIRAALFGSRSIDFYVQDTAPKGPVVIAPATVLTVSRTRSETKPAARSHPAYAYEDLGGLKREIQHIREMIELPLRYPEVFERLGIDPPKGVLLHGPPGCGKTLIARAVAHETDASFFSINGPEIIHKFYGESEAHLRRVFDDANREAPSIIFIDEIDAIAPRRETAVGEVEKRVVAQLLALMDGLKARKQVIVIAATNLPNVLDPALRRPGRFDREIAISIPDRHGRLEILEIHTRGMPLASDVNLTEFAETTYGFVGADLEALCREAAMTCLRRNFSSIDFARAEVRYDALKKLEVAKDDFMNALHEVEPSVMREVFAEVPTTKWEDVGGLDQVKQLLRESVEWPLKYRDLFDGAGVRPPKGILLCGPPGCGKTLLAKAVATTTQVNFISVKGPALMSKYVGESERAVREVFHKAKQAAPCIVFFDELDAMAPTRSAAGGDAHVSERVVGQFLTELDGVEKLKDVLILGATNRRDMIDPALLRPGRFDVVVEIPLPNEAERLEILEVHAQGKPITADVDLEAVAAVTEGMSGADLEAICQRAGRNAIRELIASGKDRAAILIERLHFDAALADLARERGIGNE
ncbi:MAG: CDC48 family AAA ATPase [Burkholderiales bacterium]|nr:CDC48 family AAA ATPase [Burkholderiales bacterium]